MLNAWKAYARRLSATLARCFPRTTAYLQAEREARQQALAATPPESRRPKARPAPVPVAPGRGRRASPETAPAEKPARAAAKGPYATPLAVDDTQVAAMRRRVAEAVAAGRLGAPSDEQWAMILSPAAATRVIAGAGSGKSTTLVLRVVFMLCHLGIDPQRLTVISFTNASCAQLRARLLDALAFWGYPFDAEAARRCVRTFHSAIAQQARALLGEARWFEQLDARDAGEPDNPLAGARLQPAQRRLLQQVYRDGYATDATFRAQVHDLLDLPPPAADAPVGEAPETPVRLAGERSPAPLYEAFHTQAGFIQSLGLRPSGLDPQALDCPPRERTFVAALGRFWQAVEARLAADGLMTFDGAFAALTERLGGRGKLPAGEALAPMSHLLIDEFQDISPQIVAWLRALHRRLARQGQAVSLMAIGDDWQSIYGWRGSSPELFMAFDKHFAARGSAVLRLETNYRSVEPVIRDAEAVLEAVAIKQAKASRAARPTGAEDHGVRLVTGFDPRNGLPALLAEIQRQCAWVASRPAADATPVLLLARRNAPLRALQAQLDPRLPVQAHTIHRAKGLQAEVAIIVDDGQPPEPHPLRSALYAHCRLFRNGYDQAMQDESLRLAYVAITRGVSRVIWYTRQPRGATLRLQGRAP